MARSVSVERLDYRDGDRQKVMTLEAGEFNEGFLVHVLPDGFKRMRYCGLLGNRHRKEKLARCRELLGMVRADVLAEPKDSADYHATRSRS